MEVQFTNGNTQGGHLLCTQHPLGFVSASSRHGAERYLGTPVDLKTRTRRGEIPPRKHIGLRNRATKLALQRCRRGQVYTKGFLGRVQYPPTYSTEMYEVPTTRKHREIKVRLCPHRAHGLVGESQHENGDDNTVSKKTPRRKEAQKSTKRQPERKRHKEKPRGAEEEGRSRDTQKCLERAQEGGATDGHARAHTPLRAHATALALQECRPQTQSFLL